MSRQLIEFTPESLAEYLEEAIGSFMENFSDDEISEAAEALLVHGAIEQLSAAYPPIHLEEGEYYMAGEGRNPNSYGLNAWSDEEVSESTYELLISKGFESPPLQIQHNEDDDFVWQIVIRNLDEDGIKMICRDFPNEEAMIAWVDTLP